MPRIHLRRILTITVAASIALILAGYAYKQYKVRSAFPWTIVLDTQGIYLGSLSCNGLKTIHSFYDPISGHSFGPFELSVSIDGNWVAYAQLDHNDEYIKAFYVEKLPLLGAPDEAHLPSDSIVLDARKAAIPYCSMSNLEWSPDMKSLAYASTQTLYIIKLPNLKSLPHKNSIPVSPIRIKLPEDNTTLAERLWREHTIISKTIHNPYIASDEAENERDQPGVVGLKEIAAASQRIKTLLGNDNYGQIATPYGFEHCYRFDIKSVGKQSVIKRSFLYAGRSIRWVSPRTILCDNWKLDIINGENPSLKPNASQMPVGSEFFTRPVWNRQGQSAAYIIKVRNKVNKYWKYSSRLVIVDSKGSIRHQVKLPECDRRVQWSRDGKQLAVKYSDRRFNDDKDVYLVYDAATLRRWVAWGQRPLFTDETPDWYLPNPHAWDLRD